MITHDIRNVEFRPGTPAQAEDGLLGFLRFETGLFRLDGVQLRRTRCRKLRLAFPTRMSAQGVEYPLVRPTSSAARSEVESALFRELQKLGVIP